MLSQDECINAIKDQIRSGRVHQHSVDILKGLLALSSSDKPSCSISATRGAKRATTRDYNTTTTQKLRERQDAVSSLPSTTARRLATELATLGSRTLAQARQSQSNTGTNALKPRSNNTPPSPWTSRHAVESKQVAHDAAVPTIIQIELVATCTHLALSHLRSYSTEKDRIRLLEASLAFSRHLLAFGLGELLRKELAASKKQFDESGDAVAIGPADSIDHVSELLSFINAASMSTNVSRLAVIFQTLVIKSVVLRNEPDEIRLLAQYLLRTVSPPHAIILQALKEPQDSDKVVMQLENLARDIKTIGACLVKHQHDETVSLAVFRLQAYASQLQRRWWSLAKHEVDTTKTLSVHLIKYMRLYVKSSTLSPRDTYENVLEAYNIVFQDAGQPVQASADFLVELQALAVAAGGNGAIVKSTDQTLTSCQFASDLDCHELAEKIRTITESRTALTDELLRGLVNRLSSKLNGTQKDYTAMVEALGKLLKTMKVSQASLSSTIVRQLCVASMHTVAWLSETYSTSDFELYRSIILIVLRICSRAQLMPTISLQHLLICADDRTIENLSLAAQTTSIKLAFTTSTETILLGEVLDMLVLRNLSDAESKECQRLIDVTEGFSLSQSRALMLARQLQSCLRHVNPKNAKQAAVLCTELLEKLDIYYPSRSHSLRRAILSIDVAVAIGKGSLPKDSFLSWQMSAIDLADARTDEGLARYHDDIKACVRVCELLTNAKRRPELAQEAIRIWSSLFHADHSMKLEDLLYDSTTSVSLLDTLLSVCQAQHWEHETMGAAHLRCRFLTALESPQHNRVSALTAWYDASAACGRVDQCETALKELKTAMAGEPPPAHVVLRYELLLMEHCFSTDDREGCGAALRRAMTAQADVTRHDKKEMIMLCAKAWWLQSQVAMRHEDLETAIHAAKSAVNIVNSLWHLLEREADVSPRRRKSSEEDDLLTDVTKKVSKLQLESTKSNQGRSSHSAAFWDLVPLACKVLLHLSELYTHAGLFYEARSHIARAVEIADAVTGSLWIARTRARLATLLVLAGLTEDAELCLTKAESSIPDDPCLAGIELHRARARLHAKLGERVEALHCLHDAVDMVEQCNLQHKASAVPVSTTDKDSCAVKSRSARTKKAATSKDESHPASMSTVYIEILEALRADKVMMESYGSLGSSSRDHSQRQLNHEQLMSKFDSACEMDVVYNTLGESSLFCPAFVPIVAGHEPVQPVRKKPAAARIKTAAAKTKAKPGALREVLADSIACLSQPRDEQVAMNDMHREARMLARSSIYARASNLGSKVDDSSSIAELISQPANIAKRRERTAVTITAKGSVDSFKLHWPTTDITRVCDSDAAQSAIEGILPTAWTVVSLMLSNDASELIVVRHRRNEQPFIVRLPFARGEADEPDEAVFDFDAGRSQLRDIVEQSNRICHVGNDNSQRMASVTWWRERETLDRKLHELLINIEVSWFGGFKGILCPERHDRDQVTNFRKQFGALLKRHIPGLARKPYELTDATLELFMGLCYQHDDDLDIDSAVLDLCYGLVDALRFNGLELAYDELDLDSLTVETIDILRSCCDHNKRRDDSHLILILDKKLHNIPWESMPYLSNASVSRMTDIASLRERLSAIVLSETGRFTVKSDTGVVILDPASNMDRTKQIMMPALRDLCSKHNSWKLTVGRIPSEVEIQQTLQSSDMLLYFGHGAGSQYIRPRTIKRLESCSKVVWLMGCSSGEVTEYDELEPTSVPSAYMLAGETDEQKCFAVVANLWDVTDKDIDQFSLAVGREWGLWSSQESPKTQGMSRAQGQPPKTPLSSPRTLRLPKGIRRAAADERGIAPTVRQRTGQCSLTEAVSYGRQACYLQHLNGAAPVVYGLPVYLE